jgi:hypothetical protein
MFDPVAALMGVLREQFAQSGVVGVTHSAGIVPLHGWLSAHHALPNLLDKAGKLHDTVFPTRYPYCVDSGRVVSEPASFLQYMAAISATVLVIGLIIDDCLDAGQIDQNGILHDDSRFCV